MIVIASSVSLRVRDVPAAAEFFTTHLGFREDVRTEDVVLLTRDDGAADIVLRERDPESVPPADPARDPLADVLVSFSVTDIAAEHDRLRREGANLLGPLRRTPWGEWTVRIADPNGVVVQLTEWDPPSG
ncbi:VOC family protein [Amycolatopsis sp. NPDC059027]|uniref:VOC family protein n=1 Tax=unclassified Amycolatopsis TaxID=2618356 RepID=UPI00366A84C2